MTETSDWLQKICITKKNCLVYVLTQFSSLSALFTSLTKSVFYKDLLYGFVLFFFCFKHTMVNACSGLVPAQTTLCSINAVIKTSEEVRISKMHFKK